MFTKTAIVALFAGLVAGQATPKGEPLGNPITRPLNEVVPACKPFTITWTPTTPNSVSLILLRGPSTNVKPLGPPIVVGIPNSGSFAWTPASSLEADTTHYGIQLIDDITGQYQYSTQFGISKGPECNSYVTPSPTSSQYGGGYPVHPPPTSVAVLSSQASVVSSTKPVVSSIKPVLSSIASNATTIVTKVSSYAPVLSTGAPVANATTVLQPTKPLSVPGSLIASATVAPNATRPGLPESTGAASGIKAGLGLVGAAAAFAFML